MRKGAGKKPAVAPLRRRAEDRLKKKKPEIGPASDRIDQKKLIHELQVHQIELEMQNEELKRAREEVEEVLAKYTDLYDFAPVGYLTFDEKGLISELNLTAARLLGIERSFLLGKPFSSFIQREFQDRLHLHLQEALETPAKQVCELVLKKKDGTTFDAQLESIIVQAKGCRLVHSVLTDISVRRQAEEAIRRFASFPQLNPNPVLETDLSGKLLFSNPATLKILKELALKKEDAGLFLPKDLEAILRNWDKKTPQTLFREVVVKNRIFAETIQLLPEFESARFYSHEITKRKQAEEALQTAKQDLEVRVVERTAQLQEMNQALEEEIVTRKQAEENIKSERKRFYDVLETMPAYVILLAADYHVPFANRVFRETFGEGNGRRCFEFLFDRSEPCEFCETYSVLKTGNPHRWEWTGPDERDYDVYDFPFIDTDGSTLIMEMGIDITERKNAEKDLRHHKEHLEELVGKRTFDLEEINTLLAVEITEHNQAEKALKEVSDELEERVQQRTAELSDAYDELRAEMEKHKKTEEALRQAHKMEAIGTLAGGIAHDFNNLLAAIMGFTEMVIEDLPEGCQERKNLLHVLKSAHRGRDLVRQILTFSRKSDYIRGPMSLTPLITETIQLLRASISSTVKIVFKTTTTLDMVLASPTEIQQILMNLATNAALAMQDNGGTLEIDLKDIDLEPDTSAFDLDIAPGEYIQLVVKDAGNGMTPEVMKRIFEPFFTTREVGKGTGMGLAVVFGIVTDLHGTITVESELGVGTLFRVFLPKIKSDVTSESTKADESPGGSERVLFIDDEELLVEWGHATLTRLGYKATSMTDSIKALKTFSADPSQFDLVITDQTMPDLTGIEFARSLLALRRDIPIILFTGHSETVKREEVQAAGIREFLRKPFGKQELAGVIRRVLDNKS